jgi:hypothetical protein
MKTPDDDALGPVHPGQWWPPEDRTPILNVGQPDEATEANFTVDPYAHRDGVRAFFASRTFRQYTEVDLNIPWDAVAELHTLLGRMLAKNAERQVSASLPSLPEIIVKGTLGGA